MKNLQALFEDVKEDFDALSIPYGNVVSLKVNRRAKRWGLCRRIAGTQTYKIEINHILLNDSIDDKGAKDTIAHELCHTIKGCMNHGPEWKRWAKKLQLFGYNIKRTDSAADKGVPEELALKKYKYVVKCNNCDAITAYNTESKVVKYVKLCNNVPCYALSCARCGHSTFTVITNR